VDRDGIGWATTFIVLITHCQKVAEAVHPFFGVGGVEIENGSTGT